MPKKTKMVICGNCNTPIAKNAIICPSCGAKNKKPFYKKWWFVLLIIIIAIGIISSIGGDKEEKFEWSEIELCNRLPEPKSNVGTVISNEVDGLDIHVEKTSKTDYKAYVEECQSMGYIVEEENDGDSYNAFDEEGYGLSLNYIGETMYIELEAPMEMGTLSWPKSEIICLLPIPKSMVGKVSSDSADGCFIYVGKTSIDDFNAYADDCAKYGFSIDYKRGDKFYNADDANGNHLSLSYQGNNVMSIQIRKADEVEQVSDMPIEKETETETTEKKSGDSTGLVDGMRPEFKKAMDSYEEFMNEYCDFMKKYADTDGTDAGLLADYADYMSKYVDVVKDFEAWDDGEMNTAEMAYYLDVQTRINKKLFEVAE